MKNTSLRTRLYFLSSVVLSAGLGCSALIYLTAPNVSEDEIVQQFAGSKMYRHNLELIGGKVNVLADSFCRWFDGLWHGRSLAFTVAWLTIFISLGFFLVARRLPADSTGGPGPSS